MDLSFLPAVNAALNASATWLLLVGRRRILRGDRDGHRRAMLAAFGVSSVFLALYITHKVSRNFENTTFHVEGLAKSAYLAFLASHVLLATTIPFIAITLITLALRGRTERHRRIARWAWPIWIYVSVTGVMIYFLLYHLNPVPLS